MLLPDGTEHEPLTWEQLVPHERDQGGYWLYGPWCGVHGEGKIWFRVKRPEAVDPFADKAAQRGG